MTWHFSLEHPCFDISAHSGECSLIFGTGANKYEFGIYKQQQKDFQSIITTKAFVRLSSDKKYLQSEYDMYFELSSGLNNKYEMISESGNGYVSYEDFHDFDGVIINRQIPVLNMYLSSSAFNKVYQLSESIMISPNNLSLNVLLKEFTFPENSNDAGESKFVEGLPLRFNEADIVTGYRN